MSQQFKYDGKMPAEALTVLDTPGNTMVSPTKVDTSL